MVPCTEDTYTAREAAEKCMMEDVIKESVSYSESSRDARMGYLTGQIAGRDARISRSLSHHPRRQYIFDPSDFRRLNLHEAIFKGFDGERVIGPGQGLSQALLEGEGGRMRRTLHRNLFVETHEPGFSLVVFQFSHSLGLNLSDSFSGDSKRLSHFLQGMFSPLIDSEAHFQDFGFPGSQRR